MTPAVRWSIVGIAVSMLVSCATAPSASTAASPSPARDVAAVDRIDMAPLRDAARGLGVRPAFRTCIEGAAGAGPAAVACIDAELQHQQARIDAALAARRGQSTSNGDVDAIQAQWRTERDRICGADGAGVPVTQRVQAGLCRLEATAARADVLAR
jgi:hypothetical protein